MGRENVMYDRSEELKSVMFDWDGRLGSTGNGGGESCGLDNLGGSLTVKMAVELRTSTSAVVIWSNIVLM